MFLCIAPLQIGACWLSSSGPTSGCNGQAAEEMSAPKTLTSPQKELPGSIWTSVLDAEGQVGRRPARSQQACVMR